MLTKTIKYTDYNGVEREETFHFNLTKAEIAEMEMTTDGGMERFINRVVEEQDGAKILELFKSLILKSYGVKSLDGRRFEKSEALRNEFSQTEAYSVLFMELATNADAAATFVRGIVPQFD